MTEPAKKEAKTVKPADSPREAPQVQDLSRVVEQSARALQDLDQRLQTMRSDLGQLLGRASAIQQAAALTTPNYPSSEALRAFALPAGAGMAFQGVNPVNLPATPIPTSGGSFAMPSAFGAGITGWSPFGGGASLPGTPGTRSVRDVQSIPPVPRAATCDVMDQGSEFVLAFELPGVRKEDLDILVTDRAVIVSAVARPEAEDGVVLLGERGPVAYRRTLPLPAEIHTNQCKASLKDGVLTLHVPKKVPTEGPKHLDVAYG